MKTSKKRLELKKRLTRPCENEILVCEESDNLPVETKLFVVLLI